VIAVRSWKGLQAAMAAAFIATISAAAVRLHRHAAQLAHIPAGPVCQGR